MILYLRESILRLLDFLSSLVAGVVVALEGALVFSLAFVDAEGFLFDY